MQTLRIRLLGSPSVYLDEHPISQAINTKAQALLYYLVTTGRTHYRNELASLFWPNMPDVQARKNLRNILPVLRACVGTHIVVTRHTATFNRYTSYWVDVERFESLVGIDASNVSTEALWEAVALYGDEFLAGFYVRNAPLFEEWMLLERERLCGKLMDTLQTLATRHLYEQDYQAALQATRQMLTIEPWCENGHRQQMQALVGLGQRSAALSQYDMCCRILDAEFHITPNDETTRLYEQIKAAIVPVPPLPTHHTHNYDTATHSPGSHLLLAETSSLPMALSSDGHVMAVPGEHSTIRLESLITRRRTHLLSGHTAAVTALCFSPDSTVLASASADHTVRLWSVASGALLTTLSGHSAAVTAIDFSANGSILASASTDHTVRLWSVTSGTLLSLLKGHMRKVVNVAFLPEDTGLVSVDSNYIIMFWNFAHEHMLTDNASTIQYVHHLHLRMSEYTQTPT